MATKVQNGAADIAFGDGAKTADDAHALFVKVSNVNLTQKDVDNIYDNWAATYDKDLYLNGFNTSTPLAAARQLAEYVKDKSTPVMDFAAGTGIVGGELKRLGFTHIDALDACQAMLDKAVGKNVYKRLICDYMGPNRLDIEDNTYGGAVATACFVTGHARQDCFLEIIESLKPGGILIIQLNKAGLAKPYLAGFEDTLKAHEDNKLWTLLKRELIPYVVGEEDGLRFVYRIN